MDACYLGRMTSCSFKLPSERSQALLRLFVCSVFAYNHDGELREFVFDISQPRFVKQSSVIVTIGEKRSAVMFNLSALLSRILTFETRQPFGIVPLVRVNKFLASQQYGPLLVFRVSAQFF